MPVGGNSVVADGRVGGCRAQRKSECRDRTVESRLTLASGVSRRRDTATVWDSTRRLISSLFARRSPFVVGAMIASCCGKNVAGLPILPWIAAKVGTLGRLRSAQRDLKCSCLRRCQSRI